MAKSEPLVTGQPSDKVSAEVRTKIDKVRLSESFSTDGLLAHADQQARDRHFEDYLIIDVDSHHYEFDHWGEIAEYIDNRVIHHIATVLPTPSTVLNAPPMYQEMG
ncbi:MAG: hypothetical protein HQ495_06180, partial [Alphaproteobacteria bacterium]|nr:hypothetical protein [Alphaproteobacteria bacterium]